MTREPEERTTKGHAEAEEPFEPERAPGTPPCGDGERATLSAKGLHDARGADGARCREDLSSVAALLVAYLPSDDRVAIAEQARKIRYQNSFLYGNYHGYYNYRHVTGELEDPRLKALQKRWFVNRRCLDVGCNEGLLTLAMATTFKAESMVGIDPDLILIQKACRHLRKLRSDTTERRETVKKAGALSRLISQQKTLSRTWFQHGDFCECKLDPAQFNTITCLSVTKWVHLHGGDAKLKALFAKSAELLAPGGYFILEPQPIKSYRSAVNKLNKAKAEHVSINEIKLQPSDFAEYLSKEHSLKLVESHKTPSPTAGYGRELLWFKKVVEVQRQT